MERGRSSEDWSKSALQPVENSWEMVLNKNRRHLFKDCALLPVLDLVMKDAEIAFVVQDLFTRLEFKSLSLYTRVYQT